MTSLPTISLLTICWNSKKTILRTIQSVLNQTILPKEYFFVDGGSTDGTLKDLEDARRQLEAKNIHCKIIHQKHNPDEAGIPSAWNQGIPELSGDIIGMLNSDDWYEPDILQSVALAFQLNPTNDAVIVPTRFLKNGKTVKIFHPHSFILLSLLMPIPHPGTFFHKKVYKQLGLYNTDYKTTADYDFVWRCYKAGIRWECLSKPMVNMELGGMANSNRASARLETFQIARKYCHPLSPLPRTAFLLRQLSGR
ncbi:MAG: glycosyltransferase family 2 protein [Lentisphaeria bacterium]